MSSSQTPNKELPLSHSDPQRKSPRTGLNNNDDIEASSLINSNRNRSNSQSSNSKDVSFKKRGQDSKKFYFGVLSVLLGGFLILVGVRYYGSDSGFGGYVHKSVLYYCRSF